MIVVSDTTSFNYLVQIGLVEILETLYGTVYIPTTVLDELRASGTPVVVREWALSPPRWLQIRQAPAMMPKALLGLDPGERDALALALEIRADKVLVDDQEARHVAEDLGLVVAGTLAVIRDGTVAGRVDYDEAVNRLLDLGFRASRAVIDKVRPAMG